MKPPKSPWCSVILPTLNEAQHLPATLRRLRQGQTANGTTDSYEVIVVDGGSTDGTPELARRHGARVVFSSCGRAQQMNTGAREARGDTLYFLHADTLPPVDWLHRLRHHGPLPCCFRLQFVGQTRHPLLRLYAWFTRFDVQAFRFGDQSLWVRREDFMAVGGFPPLQLLEDNALVRYLRTYCGGFQVLPTYVLTSPRKYLQHGVVRTQLVYTLLYLLHRAGVSQLLLVGLYRRLLR